MLTPNLWFLAKLPSLYELLKIRIIPSKGKEIRFSYACILADPLAMALAQREFPSSVGPARFPASLELPLGKSPFPIPRVSPFSFRSIYSTSRTYPRVNLSRLLRNLLLHCFAFIFMKTRCKQSLLRREQGTWILNASWEFTRVCGFFNFSFFQYLNFILILLLFFQNEREEN